MRERDSGNERECDKQPHMVTVVGSLQNEYVNVESCLPRQTPPGAGTVPEDDTAPGLHRRRLRAHELCDDRTRY